MSFKAAIEAVIQIPDFINNLIGEKPVVVTPLAGGTASVVYKLEFQDGSAQVLKFSDSPTELLHEQPFLNEWRKIGIRTPEVFEYISLPEGFDGAALLMEFVSAQNLLPLMEEGSVQAEKVLFDLGSMLATMHQVTTSGFGQIETTATGKLVGEKKTFSESLNTAEWLELVYANRSNGDLLDSELQLISKAGKLLSDQRFGLGGCYVHGDFRTGNILYNRSNAEPYTVIDPKPLITHPYLCLAYALILEEIHGRNNPICLLQGYEEITSVDQNALHAAFFLKALELFPRWGQVGHIYSDALYSLFRREKQWLYEFS